jgi:hypothetical protein
MTGGYFLLSVSRIRGNRGEIGDAGEIFTFMPISGVVNMCHEKHSLAHLKKGNVGSKAT